MKARIERKAGLLILAAAFGACGGTTGTGAPGMVGAAGTTGAAGTGAAGTGAAGTAGTTGAAEMCLSVKTAPAGACECEPSFFFQPEASSIGAGAQATRISLASYCRADEQRCPPTFEAAKAEIVRRMEQGGTVVIAGCGVRALHWRLGVQAGNIWTYDDTTGALTGVAYHDDVDGFLGGCTDASYQAGEGPPLPEGTDPALVGTHRKTCAGVTVTPL